MTDTPKSHWNYRVTKTTDKDTGEETLAVREVYYRNGEVYGYSRDPDPVQGEDIHTLRFIFEKMQRALEEPVLDLDQIGEQIQWSKGGEGYE